MVSDEQLIADLQEFADELGKVPTREEMSKCGPWSKGTYWNYFGSWNNALEKAGLEKNREVDISKERLISDLQTFAEKLGKTPTRDKMDEQGPWSAEPYRNKFGSWNNALEKAGLKKNNEVDISKERLISDLQTFAEKLGKTPTAREMNNNGPRSEGPYLNKFGSWNNALEKAGLEKNNEVDISKERLISDLQAFAEQLGKTPTRKEMRDNGPWSHNPYQDKFGSWNDALEKAGLEINRLANRKVAGTGEDYYGDNWYKKRCATVERDNCVCRVCGDDGLVHVHHIKPRREFDDVSNSNTLDNLITLCPSCHGRLEGRWKGATPDEFEEEAKGLIQ